MQTYQEAIDTCRALTKEEYLNLPVGSKVCMVRSHELPRMVKGGTQGGSGRVLSPPGRYDAIDCVIPYAEGPFVLVYLPDAKECKYPVKQEAESSSVVVRKGRIQVTLLDGDVVSIEVLDSDRAER
jgi:hypothetical protein